MKNTASLLAAAAILATLAASSCGPTLYIPNMINAPLLGEKGDFKAAVGGAGMAPDASLELHGAYALTDKLAVMANGSLMGHRKRLEWGGFRQDLVEAGLGAYTAFWPNENQFKLGRAEIFAGAGAAWAEDRGIFSMDNRGAGLSDYYRGNYQRLFLQPSFGIKTRVFDAAVSTRLAWVNFSDFRYASGGEAVGKSRFGFATVEPVLTLGLGYKYAKVFLQVGSVTPLINRLYYHRVTSGYIDIHFNGGLAFTPWKEKPAAAPPLALTPPPPENTKTEGPAPPADSIAAPLPPFPATSPAMTVGVKEGTATVCIRDNGFPDGDVISASFRGAYLLRDVELQKTPRCLEIGLRPGENNALFIHSISSGRVKPNTVLVSIADGKEERRFILQLEEGKTERIDFLIRAD